MLFEVSQQLVLRQVRFPAESRQKNILCLQYEELLCDFAIFFIDLFKLGPAMAQIQRPWLLALNSRDGSALVHHTIRRFAFVLSGARLRNAQEPRSFLDLNQFSQNLLVLNLD